MEVEKQSVFIEKNTKWQQRAGMDAEHKNTKQKQRVGLGAEGMEESLSFSQLEFKFWNIRPWSLHSDKRKDRSNSQFQGTNPKYSHHHSQHNL